MTLFLFKSSQAFNVLHDEHGDDAVVVRGEKNMFDLMGTEPYSRWDPDYWHPDFTELETKLINYSGGYATLASLLENEEVLSCDHVRASLGESLGKFETAYYTVDWIMPTGYNTNKLVYCSDTAFERLKRTALKNGDIAVAGSGKGSVGKSFVYMDKFKKSVVGDLFILRPYRINSFVLQVLLQSRVGQLQIQRHESGVSGQTHINQQEIGSFIVPLISKSIENEIEKGYISVTSLHYDAIKAASQADLTKAERCLQEANSILSKIILKLEQHLGLR